MKKWNRGIESTISLVVLAFGLVSSLQGQGLRDFAGPANAQLQDDHNDQDSHNKKSPTPPGLYVTPKVLANAVQQNLNPGLANYPNYIAGEAVKAVVSPDGTTLAILTAGFNSLYNASGVVDTAASTQFIFLYNVAGANKTSPVLQQVIQQLNSHVGLVWAPNGRTLYAAGGCDDAVYAYSNNGTSFVLKVQDRPWACSEWLSLQRCQPKRPWHRRRAERVRPRHNRRRQDAGRSQQLQ